MGEVLIGVGEFRDMMDIDELKEIQEEMGFPQLLREIRTIHADITQSYDLLTDEVYKKIIEITKVNQMPHDGPSVNEWLKGWEQFQAYLNGEIFLDECLSRLRSSAVWNEPYKKGEERRKLYELKQFCDKDDFDEYYGVLDNMPELDQAHSFSLIYREPLPDLPALGNSIFQIYVSRVPEDGVWLAIEARTYSRKGWSDWTDFAEVEKFGTCQIDYKGDSE